MCLLAEVGIPWETRRGSTNSLPAQTSQLAAEGRLSCSRRPTASRLELLGLTWRRGTFLILSVASPDTHHNFRITRTQRLQEGAEGGFISRLGHQGTKLSCLACPGASLCPAVTGAGTAHAYFREPGLAHERHRPLSSSIQAPRERTPSLSHHWPWG